MFSCDCCGICCRYIKGIEELKEFDNGDGICINLDKDKNLCQIYSSRPSICRIDEMYKVKYHRYFSKDEFYKINEESCKKLKEIYKKG
ncbi:YkgJ family cysteine cluster protein [Campylobacter geochelonis]|uniref:YkgJ family cysteine cluster protein n=1 Tax=Campylobacter geochelonis TaxID=1780362 RepID=UPI000770A0D4|nr:YkgJ family cysteine cluster protein [Campylobacter geochelonis]CZE48762.1 Flagellin N-methylase [Campylobacter geochelonis]CZE51340.1 Flagellin N-methylase [Campylobacter geochelonis]